MAGKTELGGGWQGTETSTAMARVVLYPFAADVDAGAASRLGIDLVGRLELKQQVFPDQDKPALASLTTSNTVGGIGGSFTVNLKMRPHVLRDFMAVVRDDDWVDIEIFQHARGFHVMRGRIDSIIVTDSARTGTGATRTTVQIVGRGFGSVLQLTPVFYDWWTDGVASAFAFSRVLMSDPNGIPTTVETAVRRILFGFLNELQGRGRAIWELPRSMDKSAEDPGAAEDSFVRYLRFLPDTGDDWIRDDPPRLHTGTLAWTDPKGQSVWQAMQQWADLSLCDLYCDLTHRGGLRYLKNDESCSPKDTAMTVILRDKPFPTLSRQNNGVPEPPELGPWYTQLETYVVSPHEIEEKRVGRTGAARRNAFYVAPLLTQDLGTIARDLQRPLWDEDDIRVHGIRRHQISTVYMQKFRPQLNFAPTSAFGVSLAAPLEGILGIASRYRERVRDFMCLNHLFLTGEIATAVARPDIRVGQKLQITAEDPRNLETYYIERVQHRWSPTSSSSSFTVTRGWIGPEQVGEGGLLPALQQRIKRYTLPAQVKPSDE